MRITGGILRGRQIHIPKGLPVRPTTDRVREALMNILHQRLDWEDIHVLELFSGSGIVGMEMYSRGTTHIHSVEMNAKCVRAQKTLHKQLSINKINIFQQRAQTYVKQCVEKYDLIFMDPPYEMPGQEALLMEILQKPLLKEDGILILEHRSKYDFSSIPAFVRTRTYGSSSLSFFELADDSEG
ncbi:MAG: 16S rRNA (guanine(966)-N(2))-methyltransferase RsmD [Bacteroidota bacterium]